MSFKLKMNRSQPKQNTIMSESEKLHTKGGTGVESEGFQELTNLVNDVSQQFQESIIKMIDKVNNKNILFSIIAFISCKR
ncbi:hypothetical protein EG68_11522 [Paragonimus skrjabini miyazakii]|uniref:Uncharacterized protein n=1 Tax=Paragonimus skrjabini miyazakii TaxID=59628 RepID=A0A8S9YCK8_9TREM|nr:hypothetical protein EG68_11522 [Paragonimus skrjabini miyazakii]